MLGTLVPGRVAVAAAALSATKTALTIAVRYGAQRRQFGRSGEPERPLLGYVTHQRRLLPALATTYALHCAVRHAGYEALSAFEHGTVDDRRRVDALAAGVKATVTWHAVDTAQTCRESCGGQGFLAENRLGPLRADLDAFTTFEGDNTVMLQLTARSLLADLRASLETGAGADIVRHLARPVQARIAARHRLREARFQIEAFRWRERHLVFELGRRMRRAMGEGAEADEAFLDTQDHGLEAASAYVERVVLEQFAAAVAGCPDRSLRPVLDALCSLYALHRLEAAAAWFLEHHYFGSSVGRALRPEINELCAELQPHALALVEGFALPDALVGAPIAVATIANRTARACRTPRAGGGYGSPRAK